MTLEELMKEENSNKANNPYFRKKINDWRRFALIILNDETKDLDPNTILYLRNSVSDYARIILNHDSNLVEIIAKKIEKLENIFMIKTDGVAALQSDEEDY